MATTGSTWGIDNSEATAVVTAPEAIPLTDGSSTITAGGTAQNIFAANANRKYFLFSNISSGTYWISFTTTAAPSAAGSIQIVAGAGWEENGSTVPNGAISIYGATTGTSFTAYQG